MCFSATASFGASALLAGAGVLAAQKVTTPGQRAFAVIPIIFAIQQFAEGFVWLALTQHYSGPWIQSSTLAFLFFAEVLWPLWIPLAMLQLEEDPQRRNVFKLTFVLGLVFALHTLYYLLTNRYDARIVEHHVLYRLHFPPTFVAFTWITYGVLTVLPAYLSSVSRMWLFGAPMTLSFVVTVLFYPQYIISVWCFFAALMSISVVLVIQLMGRTTKAESRL